MRKNEYSLSIFSVRNTNCFKYALCAIICASISATQADVIWFTGNNPVTNLEYQTGQSSEGRGLAVDWKDSTIKPTAPHQIGGDRDDLSVIQYQPVPPLQSYTLFSFNNAFGSGPNQISTSNIVLSARLWLNVTQVAGVQSISIQGLRAADSDWNESQASFALKDEALSTAWFGGGDFSGSLFNNYGTIGNPSTTGWVYIDITSAFQDYQHQIISGIALISSSEATAEVHNFYAQSNQALDVLQAPGLYVAFMIPEPGVAGLMAGGLGLLWWARRKRKVLLLCAGGLLLGAIFPAQGAQVWLYGGNQVAALEQATGQSSGGTGQSVAWKDTQFKSSATMQIGGGREIIGVIQRQAIPPLEGFVMLSLNDLFGTTGRRIPPSSDIDEAWLWVYVAQTTKQMPLSIFGVRPDDRDWGEQAASFLFKQNTLNQLWAAGAAGNACTTAYGTFEAPGKLGWFKVPVNLAQALDDYRDGRIGGLALLAPPESTTAIRTFYFCSNEHPQAGLRPGIFVSFSEAAHAPASQSCALSALSAQNGTAQIRVQAAQAGDVQVDGRSASYDFGGVWTFELPIPPDESSQTHRITLSNAAGMVTQRVTAIASFAQINGFTVQDQLAELHWEPRSNRYDAVYFSEDLDSPVWLTLPGTASSPGHSLLSAEAALDHEKGYLRVKSVELNIAE